MIKNTLNKLYKSTALPEDTEIGIIKIVINSLKNYLIKTVIDSAEIVLGYSFSEELISESLNNENHEIYKSRLEQEARKRF